MSYGLITMKNNETRRTDLNLAAARIMLAPISAAAQQSQLGALAKAARARLTSTQPCPACESEGPHEHNGDALDPTLLCVSCGETFDES